MACSYVVEILANFEAKLQHTFSEGEIEEVGNITSDAVEHLISDIQTEFSGQDISIYLNNEKKIKKENCYNLVGDITRCFTFPETAISDGELIDGTFDSQLNDMRRILENACCTLGFDIVVTQFNWADDEVIEYEQQYI